MKNSYISFIIAAGVLALSACKSSDKGTGAPVLPPTPVNVVEAQKSEALYYDKYQGIAVALNSVELRSQVGGFITGIFFKEGEVVTKGSPLYEIDRRKYVAAYEQANANVISAKANLVKAQKDIDRYNMLLKADAVARQTVDQATASFETAKGQVAVAQAALSSAATDLSYATIRAPFTGRIGISQVKLGAQVTPGTTLLNTISTGNPMGVDVVINEQDINRFYKLQQHASDTTFKLQLSDGTTYAQNGRLFAIDRGVNNQTGSIKVRVQFPNAQDVLRDGMSCVLQVLNDNSGERVQIPYKAITEQMGEFFVFTVRDTTVRDTAADKTVKDRRDTLAHQVKVVLGQRIQSNVIIMQGIKPGDKIVTEGFQRLRDGGKVTQGPAAAAPGAAPKK
ncbi:efflux RND transporter periplasmic adaptor subunit [Mucilaginibacter psychrotolerans]|uniref:Efflux RND transporter periplasmic adaptor subunit n=1 Tax=Mucilaginibacter psychrotolerans TaxID=1524096 RepID=A0A4Y8SJF4_9SPHI|nr:efflux RND transporter periplasmic adaptor subunit [Mucilaginibacter psychrotolerans]TFF39189.1 efflux RND transporter periplasmic adaptor subunit [Mucilaginibacter psychrotolerans]